MVGVLWYIMFAYGLANILVYGEGPFDIVTRFRDWVNEKNDGIGKMFDCMMCMSANIGWITSAVNYILFPSVNITIGKMLFGDLWIVGIVVDLFATSGAVWLLHTIQTAIEGKEA